MKDEMTRAEKSEEAALITSALQMWLDKIESTLKRKKKLKLTEEIIEMLEEDITDTQKVLDKYEKIYDDNTGPTMEQLEDALIEIGRYEKEDIEKKRLKRGSIQALLDHDIIES